MSMKEPSPRASRLALAAGIVAVAVVGGGGFLLGQRSIADQPTRVAQPLTVAPAPKPTPIASPPEVLGRTELLSLAADAADATARGAAIPASVRDAVGKPFALALPFGCEGSAEADSTAPMRWRYDEAAGALRLHVTPATWSPDEWFTAGTPSQTETIEGFWLPRPWTSSDACPVARSTLAPAGAEPITLAGQTLALGQLFGADGARQGRRDGKAYQSVLKMARAEFDGRRGLSLRLTGRLAGGSTGVTTCRQPGGADQRPVCLLLISLEEIAIADPMSAKVLTTWRNGSLRVGEVR